MEAVDYYLERARSGLEEEAFFGLLEIKDDPIPALKEAYRIEIDPKLRALIVRIVWERRQLSSIPFLAEALTDPHPETWKQAIDGLAAFGIPDAKRALEAASEGPAGRDDERRIWFEEAIDQMGH